MVPTVIHWSHERPLRENKQRAPRVTGVVHSRYYVLCNHTRIQTVNTFRRRQNWHRFADGILKRFFLNIVFISLFEFHWNMFPWVQLSIWFRWRFGADQATTQYMNQWWASLLTNIFVMRPQWANSSHYPAQLFLNIWAYMKNKN